MSELRKGLIDQILAFPANTYSREFLDGPHPKTGKPYSTAELETYLKELQQAAPKPAPKTPQPVQQSPEQARIQAQQVWEHFFSRHLDIPANAANRKALFERGLSLSDDEMVRPVHLDEAAKLLIAEGTIKTKKVLTATEFKERAPKDLATFRDGAIQLGFAANTANEKLIREALGSGYSVADIAQAITNGLQLAPVGQDEQQRRDEQERESLVKEIIASNIHRPTGQELLQFGLSHEQYVARIEEKMRRELAPITTDQLRVMAQQIRDRSRFSQMSPRELRAYIKSQSASTSTVVEELPKTYTSGQLELIIEANPQEFKELCSRYGWRQIEQRFGYVPPKVQGIIRDIRMEFGEVS